MYQRAEMILILIMHYIFDFQILIRHLYKPIHTPDKNLTKKFSVSFRLVKMIPVIYDPNNALRKCTCYVENIIEEMVDLHLLIYFNYF